MLIHSFCLLDFVFQFFGAICIQFRSLLNYDHSSKASFICFGLISASWVFWGAPASNAFPFFMEGMCHVCIWGNSSLRDSNCSLTDLAVRFRFQSTWARPSFRSRDLLQFSIFTSRSFLEKDQDHCSVNASATLKQAPFSQLSDLTEKGDIQLLFPRQLLEQSDQSHAHIHISLQPILCRR